MRLPDPVGIAGLGVMGGSLARSLAARGVRVRGWSPDPSELRAAVAEGAVAEGCSSAEASAAGVAWWIVATPLGALPEVFRAGVASEPARVMDLASLQEPALAAAAEAGFASVHVSAHPMAGSERSGFAASSTGLYAGVPVWLSVGPEAGAALRDEAAAFWTALGAEPRWTDPGEHDERMVVASHLPQLASNALALVLERAGLHPDDLGPGGRDATRLAGSHPGLWADLLHHSGVKVAPLLRALAAEASALADRLDADDRRAVESLLARTRRWRVP